MGQSIKRKRQNQGLHAPKTEPPNQTILDSIGNPNPWTPAVEDAWLKELSGLLTGEIYRQYPPLRKPPNVSKRGKGSGWGG